MQHAGEHGRPGGPELVHSPRLGADHGPIIGEDGVTLADLADRYRLLVEHTPDAICVHQLGVIVYMNPSGLRYLDASDAPDRVIGRYITDFIHPDSIGPMLTRIADLDGPGAVSEPSEALVITVNGGTIPAEAVSVRTTWNGEPAFQVILRDLTDQKAAQEALHYQAALLSHVSDAIVGICPRGLVTSWNPAAEAVYGRTADDVIGRELAVALGVACYPAAIIAAGGRIRDTHRRADGLRLDVTVAAAEMDGGFVLVCADQTALRRVEAHFTAVVESLDEGVVVLDRTHRVTSANRAAKTILDIEPGQVTAGRVHALPFVVYDTDEQPIPRNRHPVVITRDTGEPATAVVGIERRRDSRRFWLSMTATLLDAGDAASPVVVSFVDITDQYHASIELEHAATHDHLTGLPNRTAVLARLDQELAQDRTRPVAVMFIDLDNFKAINDSHGHAVGDAVLSVVAERLTDALHADSFVGRIGGDEFVAVVPDSVGTEAEEVRTELSAPIVTAGGTLTMAASIGQVLVEPGDIRSAQNILNDADLEMYQAKPLFRQLASDRPS